MLDVGGGIGVIQHELLGKDVESAILVEAASAYVALAREETEARGNGAKTQLLHGDFATMADQVPEADVVTLDRVVCCYPDYDRLLTASADKARRAVVLSYPRDRWYVRLVVAVQNLARRLRRDPFRTFVHPTTEIHRVLSRGGLSATETRDSVAWRVALYQRPVNLAAGR